MWDIYIAQVGLLIVSNNHSLAVLRCQSDDALAVDHIQNLKGCWFWEAAAGHVVQAVSHECIAIERTDRPSDEVQTQIECFYAKLCVIPLFEKLTRILFEATLQVGSLLGVFTQANSVDMRGDRK